MDSCRCIAAIATVVAIHTTFCYSCSSSDTLPRRRQFHRRVPPRRPRRREQSVHVHVRDHEAKQIPLARDDATAFVRARRAQSVGKHTELRGIFVARPLEVQRLAVTSAAAPLSLSHSGVERNKTSLSFLWHVLRRAWNPARCPLAYRQTRAISHAHARFVSSRRQARSTRPLGTR